MCSLFYRGTAGRHSDRKHSFVCFLLAPDVHLKCSWNLFNRFCDGDGGIRVRMIHIFLRSVALLLSMAGSLCSYSDFWIW